MHKGQTVYVVRIGKVPVCVSSSKSEADVLVTTFQMVGKPVKVSLDSVPFYTGQFSNLVLRPTQTHWTQKPENAAKIRRVTRKMMAARKA